MAQNSTASNATDLAFHIIPLDTTIISQWKSIVTLVVFVGTNIAVLFPYDFPIPVPSGLIIWGTRMLVGLRILPRSYSIDKRNQTAIFTIWQFPVNFITAPLIAVLFLLAILVIGRDEVYDGTIGANNINPIDIMAFFLTLAYIAISIDASGLIRYLAFKVLTWGGGHGQRLYFYLYAFFFSLGTFIGNDPIILSGTAFLAYLTRVSQNIKHPRAWTHAQFAVANIASAILVSSNPTNLVLAGAFNIRFVVYTANMIVPVAVTAIVTFPFLLYVIFTEDGLIPDEIRTHELPDNLKGKKAINPNIPNAGLDAQALEDVTDNKEIQERLRSLEQILNPFVDRKGAFVGATIMAATLISVLALNASNQSAGERPVFYVTLPAAFLMLCWDLSSGWTHRHKTRAIAKEGRENMEKAQRRREEQAYNQQMTRDMVQSRSGESGSSIGPMEDIHSQPKKDGIVESIASRDTPSRTESQEPTTRPNEKSGRLTPANSQHATPSYNRKSTEVEKNLETGLKSAPPSQHSEPLSLISKAQDAFYWCQETFPTVTAVFQHLPFALIPFAFCMFILVEALVTKGWVPVFAYGWDRWVQHTGTIGAIGGMAFLSVILCNFAGTNIGTTILLSRVIQCWIEIHPSPADPVPSDRDFWATVYAMALGVNFGAFSTAFSASLAGLLWRDILNRKHIKVSPFEFARINLPIIAVAMVVGCLVLIGEVYIIRSATAKFDYKAVLGIKE